MLRVLISCLLVGSALADSYDDCKVGNITFTGFDIEKYLGAWYDMYRIPNAAENDLTCEAQQLFKTEDGIGIESVAYNTRIGSFETLNGIVSHWTENAFQQSYPDDEYWTSNYWVAGTDYKTYSILRTCLGGDNEHPLTWVRSRRTTISDDTEQEVNKILKNFDLSLDDFEPINQVDCGTYESY